ncbi:hypothetical protein OA527_05745 [Pelagibacteraceae bacterium]|nr:hypothetical protein [Pelagibacteraceae bacterium]
MNAEFDKKELDIPNFFLLVKNNLKILLFFLLSAYILVFVYYTNQDVKYSSEINISTKTIDIFEASLNNSIVDKYNFGNAAMFNKKVFFTAYREEIFSSENIDKALRAFNELKKIKMSEEEIKEESLLLLNNIKAWDYTREDNMIVSITSPDYKFNKFFIEWYVPFVEEKVKSDWIELIKNGLLLSGNVERTEIEKKINSENEKISLLQINLEIQKQQVLENLNYNLRIAEKIGMVEMSIPPYELLSSSSTFTGDNQFTPYSEGKIPLYFYGTKVLNEEIAILNSRETTSLELEATKISVKQLKDKININKKNALEAGITEPEYQYASLGAITIFSTIKKVLENKSVVNYNLELIRHNKVHTKLSTLIVLSTFVSIFISILIILIRWKYFNPKN